MPKNLMNLYYRLPVPVRSLAATARGYQLRKWRYGPETPRITEEAREHEQWTPDQWREWREERLADVLHRAATQVPYYREQWAARRRNGDSASPAFLENWPVLEKDVVKANPRAFIADDCDEKSLFHLCTSGTTGKPLDLWHTRETLRTNYALTNSRIHGWFGGSRSENWALIGGQLVTPASRRRPPFWVWNAAAHQLYCSSCHLAPDLIPHYLEAFQRYRITQVYGYTSSLYAIAQEVVRREITDLRMKVVITNAEPLDSYQRETIAQAFGCPVEETYSMTEYVLCANECPSGRLHLWPEMGVTEVLEGDQPVASGQIGDLVGTGLTRMGMPLIRYRVGDRGVLPAGDTPCPCGRKLPHIESVEGRKDDVLYTKDGRSVARLLVFRPPIRIREGQVIQKEIDLLEVRYVPMPEFDASDEEWIRKRLRERMGPIQVQLRALDEIPRGANGKFRSVVSELTEEQKASLRRKDGSAKATLSAV